MGLTDDSSRRPQRPTPLEQVEAIDRAFSEPRRLVDVVSQADTYEEAAEAVGREFHITKEAARVVIDNQVKLLTREGAVARRRQVEMERQRAEPFETTRERHRQVREDLQRIADEGGFDFDQLDEFDR